MKRYMIFFIILSFSLLMCWSSCKDYATEVDPLINQVEDERLTDESQISFVINGVKTRFSTNYDVLVLLSGLLSDELFFDSNVPNATFPTFNDIDLGDITKDNNSVDGCYNSLGELRFFSDDLLRRIGEISFTNENLKKEAQFYGNLYAGIARYIYATYFGLTENQPGGVIDNGPFIPAAAMYDDALAHFEAAKASADFDADEQAYWIRVVNSLSARIHLIEGNYSEVQTSAQNGMADPDAPFQSLHSVQSDNYLWQQAGVGRTQAVVDWRYKNYVISNAQEWARVQLDSIMGNNDVLYYRQGKYLTEEAPITFMSWQENELMLAEVELRAGNDGAALTKINAVRASHGIDPVAAADMNLLIEEREKELFVTGMRYVDQIRLDDEYGIWHLGAEAWKYFPITERERNINPNFD
jgi:hypothetical protein